MVHTPWIIPESTCQELLVGRLDDKNQRTYLFYNTLPNASQSGDVQVASDFFQQFDDQSKLLFGWRWSMPALDLSSSHTALDEPHSKPSQEITGFNLLFLNRRDLGFMHMLQI